MNEQCKTCEYSDYFCKIKSDENGKYIRVDNATELCNYYLKRSKKNEI